MHTVQSYCKSIVSGSERVLGDLGMGLEGGIDCRSMWGNFGVLLRLFCGLIFSQECVAIKSVCFEWILNYSSVMAIRKNFKIKLIMKVMTCVEAIPLCVSYISIPPSSLMNILVAQWTVKWHGNALCGQTFLHPLHMAHCVREADSLNTCVKP